MISIDKTYERQDGAGAMVKFTDGPHGCPVGVITCGIFVAYGHNMLPVGMDVHPAVYCAMRLVEVSQYADFKIDDPVMVRSSKGQDWNCRYFAGVGLDGNAKAFVGGANSWTKSGGDQGHTWNQCRRPTAEELAS